jgi:RimJ/RimL family protein N-acetyltransferase
MPLIRPFQSGDCPGLVQAIDAVCGEGRWMKTTRFEPTPGWSHALEEPDCSCHLLLVAEDAGRVVGWCRTFPGERGNGAQEATLGIGLLSPYRDRGIGTALVRHALRWAKGAGYRRVRLTTHPDNARAIRVFARCGFVFSGHVTQDALEMACDLVSCSHTQGEGNGERYALDW